MKIFVFLAAAAAAMVTVPAAAQSFRPGVNVMDDNPLPVKSAAPLRATSTLTNGTIATGGTFQSVLAASATRNGCTIQNKSIEAMRVFLGAPGSATVARSFDLPAGGSFSCASGLLVLTDEISLTSATNGSAFVVARQ